MLRGLRGVVFLTYDELLINYEGVVKVKEADFSKKYFLKDLKGLYKNGKIVLNSNISNKEKACVLAEELGHHFTSSGNILDSNDIRNIKQEKRARNWGYEKLIGIIDIVNAFNLGLKNKYEMSEHLNVTEEFLEEAINYYKEKYGVYYEIDDYIICFEPSFGIIKRF